MVMYDVLDLSSNNNNQFMPYSIYLFTLTFLFFMCFVQTAWGSQWDGYLRGNQDDIVKAFRHMARFIRIISMFALGCLAMVVGIMWMLGQAIAAHGMLIKFFHGAFFIFAATTIIDACIIVVSDIILISNPGTTVWN